MSKIPSVEEQDRAAIKELHAQISTLQEKLNEERESIKYTKEHYFFVELPANPCQGCGGRGKRAYSNTSTWRHGIGGQAITNGVCDKCWGSGVDDHKDIDLRLYEIQMKQLKKHRWIPVSERLPELNKKVLFTNGSLFLGYYVDSFVGWRHGVDGIGQVTHWMDVIDPPTGEQESKK